mmetsp:Transcript_39438/g.126400  ORF Transcript_39438/g.126400 Transcript_39438/m.126400 type:complete len:202 (+) Transcript_39438:1970-2575(+)
MPSNPVQPLNSSHRKYSLAPSGSGKSPPPMTVFPSKSMSTFLRKPRPRVWLLSTFCRAALPEGVGTMASAEFGPLLLAVLLPRATPAPPAIAAATSVARSARPAAVVAALSLGRWLRRALAEEPPEAEAEAEAAPAVASAGQNLASRRAEPGTSSQGLRLAATPSLPAPTRNAREASSLAAAASPGRNMSCQNWSRAAARR